MKYVTLYETHINTIHLEKAIKFYQNLDLELAYKLEERRAAFFWLGDPKKKEQMLGVWEVSEEQWVSKHFAFHVTLDQLISVPKFLSSKGIELRGCFGLEPIEPIVHAWMPAAAYYFKDLDGNSLEYITILEGDSEPELGVLYFSEWKKISKTKNGSELN